MVDNKESQITIETKNRDGTISEIDVSFGIAEYDKKFCGKEKYYKRKTKNYPSFDELMQQNESCEEDGIAKLPAQLAAPSFESEAISNIENEILKEAIKKISEKHRRRLELCFFKGLTFKEIGISENVSKMAICYSIQATIKRLKKLLEEFNF